MTQLNAEGANIVLSSHFPDEPKIVAESLPDDGEKMVTPFDVIGEQWVVSAAGDVLDRFGQAGILINNAWLAQRTRVVDADLSVCRAMMDVNFFPPVTGFMIRSAKAWLRAVST